MSDQQGETAGACNVATLPEEDGENMEVKDATFQCVATDPTRISGTENGSELAVQPPQLLLPQQQCTSDEHVGVDMIGNEDDEVLFLGFSQPAPCSLKFYPVNEVWRQKLCRDLGLRYIGHNGIATGGPDVCLTTPLSIKRIRGDGNIFYRSISHINTGSEDQHLTVCKAVVNLMRITGDVLTGDSTVDIKTYINNSPYINNSRVEQDGTWAVKVNIYATQHLLKVYIYIYSEDTNIWTKIKLYGLDTSMARSDICEMGIHINNPRLF